MNKKIILLTVVTIFAILCLTAGTVLALTITWGRRSPSWTTSYRSPSSTTGYWRTFSNGRYTIFPNVRYYTCNGCDEIVLRRPEPIPSYRVPYSINMPQWECPKFRAQRIVVR